MLRNVKEKNDSLMSEGDCMIETYNYEMLSKAYKDFEFLEPWDITIGHKKLILRLIGIH